MHVFVVATDNIGETGCPAVVSTHGTVNAETRSVVRVRHQRQVGLTQQLGHIRPDAYSDLTKSLGVQAVQGDCVLTVSSGPMPQEDRGRCSPMRAG